MGEPLIGHTTAVWALTGWITPEGRTRLASAAEDACIRIWDPETGEEAAPPLTGHVGWISTLAAWTTADGSRLASGGFDGTIRIWDTDRGEPVGQPLTGHDGPVLKVFHWRAPDGVNHLASTGDDGTVRIWDADQVTDRGGPLVRHTTGTWGLTGWTSPDGGTKLAVAGTDGTIQIWDPLGRRRVGEPLAAHRGTVGALTAWSGDDGARLASLGADGAIRYWDPESGVPVGEPAAGVSGWLPAIASWRETDGSVRLACAGPEGTIRVWDFDTGQDVVGPLVGHTSSIWTLASWRAADGRSFLAAAGDDATVRLWNTETGRPAGEPLLGHTAGVWALTWWTDRDGGVRLASAGDDASIRRWDTASGRTVGSPLLGHTGWITALESWTTQDGAHLLASGGIDGTIRRWNADTGEPVGEPLSGGDGRVLALAVASTPDGRHWLASGGSTGSVRVWDAATGERLGPELTGHSSTVRGLAAWTTTSGQPRFASAGFDGTVRIWDPVRGECAHELTGHTGQVAGVTAWAESDGRTLLASGGDDSTIRVWDVERGSPVGEPLVGHTAGIWALTHWTGPDGRTLLASTGEDGTIRLWDPLQGHAVRTIEVGRLAMRGLSDAPTRVDVLGRNLLADAVVQQFQGPASDIESGPAVVSVEGPWGCGKTTFMELIRERIERSPSPLAPEPARLTVRQAIRRIKDHGAARAHRPPNRAGTGTVTAWFNPWVHESGEQIWAGLAQAIIEAGEAVLFPHDAGRERYWFDRNLQRVDRYALRRALMRRVVSPLLAVAVIAIVVPFAITLAQLNQKFTVGGTTLSTADLALAVGAGFLLTGTVDTAIRYGWSPAAHYLPGEMLHLPMTDPVTMGGPGDATTYLTDPRLRTRAGPLFLHQNDIGSLLADLSASGYRMVIFIDDIDRCRASTTVEVFEAVNVFLSSLTSGHDMHARFVIGLDPNVVAGHLGNSLEGAYRFGGADGARHEAAGWAYLRKLIQLPVILPQISESGVENFVDVATGLTRSPGPLPPAAGSPPPPAGSPPPPDADRAQPGSGTPAAGQGSPQPPPEHGVRREATETLAWRSLEQHPEVRNFIAARLAAQPNRSLRDAKRLLNVWQLYERVLALSHPLADPDPTIRRTKQLLVLAEIITRWPGLQSMLHRRYEQGRGLELLAASAADDARWEECVRTLAAGSAVGPDALTGLRALLLEHDGTAVSRLAAEVL
ncbi:P-loop NTPase fold protein [Streptomyces sp. NPDC003480]